MSFLQNYTNPFSAGGGSAFGGNPETTIGYQIPDAGHVTMVIYNTMGQAVKRLLDKDQSAGYYRVTWDGKDEQGNHLGSGMYMARMSAGDLAIMKKILLIR
jgi:flagellar hook assembly protein FlgD